MLHSDLRRRGLPAAATAAGGAALALALYAALALSRLTAAGQLPAATPLGFLCALAGPPLPYLGAALLPAALAVMAPCLLQLALALVAAAAGVSATSGLHLWRAGLGFAAGFLGVYALAAGGVALAGELLAEWGFLLRAAGGLLLAGLGLAVLRVLPRRLAASCRGPRWLILSGRASLRQPFAAGGVFALYCLGCCGPYLAGLALLGAGTGSAAGGAALVMLFALLMGGLLLLPVLGLGLSRRVGTTLMQHGAPVALAAGSALVALGSALALEPLIIWALSRNL